MMAIDSVDVDVIFKEGNWVNRCLLIYEDYVLAVSMGLRTREAEDASVRVPQ